MKPVKFVGFLLGTIAIAPVTAHADGFSSAHTQQFRLNVPNRDLTVEAMRINQNAAARAAAAGAANGQGNSNMANVIQITENYNMVLNGDNNSLSTTGSTVDGQQVGTGFDQAANNQVQTNQNSTVAGSGNGDAAVPPLQLNP